MFLESHKCIPGGLCELCHNIGVSLRIRRLNIRPEKSCVSTNPTDPDFCADPAVFIAILKENKKISLLPTLEILIYI